MIHALLIVGFVAGCALVATWLAAAGVAIYTTFKIGRGLK